MSRIDQRLRASTVLPLVQQIEMLVLVISTILGIVDAGFVSASGEHSTGLGLLAPCGMALLTLMRFIDMALRRPRDPERAIRKRLPPLTLFLRFPVVWLLCSLLCALATPQFLRLVGVPDRLSLWVRMTDVMLILMALVAALRFGRYLAATTQNSALLLVGSFLAAIVLGTLLLRLPACRAGASGESAPWNVALFTATSAVCVTGLIVVPTGSYWSTGGHAVILALIQFGGLGILTFGAFMAVLSRSGTWRFREAATLRELLDSESVQSSRSLLRTILFFTLLTEAVGAVCLLGLWTEDARVWNSVFHSVSAFCNAGFSLRDDGLMGMSGHWQVSVVMTSLILLGGLGFAVVQDVFRFVWRSGPRPDWVLIFGGASDIRPRLSVHSRLVLVTGALLLALGFFGFFALESLQVDARVDYGRLVTDSWFQSVTFRTAGFNTVDHEQLHPASKLLAIFLMFIGAAPGSTGGGVKTVIVALMFLNLVAVLRGKNSVEVFGRTIAAGQVSRSLAIIGVGLAVVITTSGLLMIFEQNPGKSLDYLFEATSAFATVGVSAGVTFDLSLPSRIVIIGVMFLGRVGPITLLLAMSGQPAPARYILPEERVSLG